MRENITILTWRGLKSSFRFIIWCMPTTATVHIRNTTVRWTWRKWACKNKEHKQLLIIYIIQLLVSLFHSFDTIIAVKSVPACPIANCYVIQVQKMINIIIYPSALWWGMLYVYCLFSANLFPLILACMRFLMFFIIELNTINAHLISYLSYFQEISFTISKISHGFVWTSHYKITMWMNSYFITIVKNKRKFFKVRIKKCGLLLLLDDGTDDDDDASLVRFEPSYHPKSKWVCE